MRQLTPKLKTNYFSRSHLGIFLIIFAVIGAIILIKSLAAPNPNLPGDLNNDNVVNVTDMSILLSNYGTTNSSADINGDGTVNVLDLSILLSHYGQTYGGGSTRIYTADFSTGDFSQVDSQQESSADRITLISPGLGGNQYAAKIICGPQDTGVAGSSGNQRTELSVQSFSPHLGGGSLQGKDVWVEWVFKIASPFTAPTNWRDIGQFHAGVGSPSFAYQAHSDGTFWIEQRGGTYVNGSGNYKTIQMPTPSFDVAHTIIVFRHWSTGSDGITKVWYDKDSTQVPNVSLAGPTLETGYESAPYMKYGMYGQSNVADNTVYVSNIRWATTAAGL